MSKPPPFPFPLAGEADPKNWERGNHPPHILIFDSGLGGLSVFSEITKACPHAQISYLADDAVFPYGALSENALTARVMELMEHYIPKLVPDVVVIACNTASTLVLPPLRARFGVAFVGTVPAIKPASERSKSRMFSVLATPGTVARDYTKDLIRLHAGNCTVTLVGAPNLAKIAEEYLANDPRFFPSPLEGEGDPKDRVRGDRNLQLFHTSQTCVLSPLTGKKTLTLPSPHAFESAPKGQMSDDLLSQIRAEISPAFIKKNNIRTDMIVLACTHYPLILPLLQQAAPWQVEWINPARAIARRVKELLQA